MKYEKIKGGYARTLMLKVATGLFGIPTLKKLTKKI